MAVTSHFDATFVCRGKSTRLAIQGSPSPRTLE